MLIDRARAARAFAAYVRPYNSADPKVALKISHTYRVAALCERIARSLALPPQDVDLAWLCGLLHDVGRFEQLRRFGTFNDAQSIDHAAAGAAVLFEQGRVREYLDDGSEDALLRTAVAWHSAYRLPPDLDARTRRFCAILRDADKVDILRVNVETPMEDIYGVTTRALRRSPVSPAVLEAFYAHHAVLRSLKQPRWCLSWNTPKACAPCASRGICSGCSTSPPTCPRPPTSLPRCANTCAPGWTDRRYSTARSTDPSF